MCRTMYGRHRFFSLRQVCCVWLTPKQGAAVVYQRQGKHSQGKDMQGRKREQVASTGEGAVQRVDCREAVDHEKHEDTREMEGKQKIE